MGRSSCPLSLEAVDTVNARHRAGGAPYRPARPSSETA